MLNQTLQQVATLRHNNEYATRLRDSFGLETFQYPNVSHFFSSSKFLNRDTIFFFLLRRETPSSTDKLVATLLVYCKINISS